MTDPKQKAIELVEKFEEYTDAHSKHSTIITNHAKQCALICCDEVLKELGEIDQYYPVNLDPRAQYYLAIKEEISLL